MRIAFTINSLSKGGAQRVFSNLMNYVIEHDDEVYLIMLNKSPIEYDINKKINIFYVNNYERNKKNIIITTITFIKNIFKMKKILNQIHPDVILSFLPITNFVTLWANNNKYPIVVSTRNDHNIEFPNKKYQFLMQKLYNKADGFIFQTEEQKAYFDTVNIKKKYAIIPNPINENFLVERYKGKREKVIVSVGRLVKQKNQELIIDAFNDIKDKIPKYKLIIYGEGELRGKFIDKINELNLSDRIFLPGKVDNIKEKIYKSSLFILSSNYEGMPNSLMEAMSLGLPVIATDCPCGGPKSLVKNGENGVLIPVDGRKELSLAILKVIKNEEFSEKIQKNAVSIQKKLDPALIYSKYYDFFEEIIKEKKVK